MLPFACESFGFFIIVTYNSSLFLQGDVGRTSPGAEIVLAWERSLYPILSRLSRRLAFGPSRTCGKTPAWLAVQRIIWERVIERFFRTADPRGAGTRPGTI